MILESSESFTLTIRSGSLPDRATRGNTFQATVTIFDFSSKFTSFLNQVCVHS